MLLTALHEHMKSLRRTACKQPVLPPTMLRCKKSLLQSLQSRGMIGAMQKKIYVVGMFDEGTATNVHTAVSAVAGVNSCTTSTEKSQVLVDFDEATGGIEDAINAAIAGTGVEVLG